MIIVECKVLYQALQNKTQVLLAVAAKDPNPVQLLSQRVNELNGVVEMLECAEPTAYTMINQVRAQQEALVEQIQALEGHPSNQSEG